MKHVWRKYTLRHAISILVGGVVLSGIFFLILSLFQIKHIEVEPPTVSVVIDSTQLPTNLIFFPGEKLRTFLLKEYPRIQDVQFEKKFPNTLKIAVLLREPIARIVGKERSLAIDNDGMLFELAGQEPLPQLELELTEMIPGKIASGKGLQTSLAFIDKLSHDEAVERVVLSTDSTLQVTMKDVTVLLLPEAQGAQEADTLQALLKGFRMKGLVPRLIDLRFSKPIITP